MARGAGWTTIKRPRTQLDLKASLQYEKQDFLSGPLDGINPAGISQDLVSSTLSSTYLLMLPKGVVFNQQVACRPAFNATRTYSATESDRAYSATKSNSVAVPF